MASRRIQYCTRNLYKISQKLQFRDYSTPGSVSDDLIVFHLCVAWITIEMISTPIEIVAREMPQPASDLGLSLFLLVRKTIMPKLSDSRPVPKRTMRSAGANLTAKLI